MKSEGKNFNAADWEDFSHTSTETNSSGPQLFKTYQTFKAYIDNLPKTELVNRGWMHSPDDIGALSALFFQLHTDKKQVLFRKSAEAKAPILAVWLAKARTEAELSFHTQKVAHFNGLTADDLRAIAQSSVDVEVLIELPSILARKGVILVFLNALPGMKLDGAAFRLTSGNPVVAMSIRFPRLDSFWFTLLHELAHVNLHADLLGEPICDDLDVEGDDAVEIAANKLAKASFVERSVWRNCEPKYDTADDAVIAFARKAHIHPAIVAGMLRKETGNYTRYSRIVNAINVRDILFKS